MSEATQSMTLTPRQEALIRVVRGIKNGVLEEVIVRNGEPVVIKAGVQRIDLDKADEREQALSLNRNLSENLAVNFNDPDPEEETPEPRGIAPGIFLDLAKREQAAEPEPAEPPEGGDPPRGPGGKFVKRESSG